MTRSRRVFGRIVAVFVSAAALGGCSVHYTDLSASAQQAPQYKLWPAPKLGRWLCLTSTPGTPIYSGPSPGGQIIGYTRQVVAFQGQQSGRWISIIPYDRPEISWIDGRTIKPFQPAFPGQRCIVYEDTRQRPVFEID